MNILTFQRENTTTSKVHQDVGYIDKYHTIYCTCATLKNGLRQEESRDVPDSLFAIFIFARFLLGGPATATYLDGHSLVDGNTGAVRTAVTAIHYMFLFMGNRRFIG